MDGESGHSNCFVDKERVVIYDSMFEHVREEKHMMAILRHEMGH